MIKLLWRTPSKDTLEWAVLLAFAWTLMAALVFLSGHQPWGGLEVLTVLSLGVAARQVVLFHTQLALAPDAPEAEHVRERP